MNYTKEFSTGAVYRIFNYDENRMETITIVSRKDKWLTVTLNNKTFEVRATQVTNPYAESILIDGYCPVFSYEKEIKNEVE